MICYRDMTFCTFFHDCAVAKDCPRALTMDIREAAKKWWHNDEPPIATFMGKPECHVTDSCEKAHDKMLEGYPTDDEFKAMSKATIQERWPRLFCPKCGMILYASSMHYYAGDY